MRELLDKLMEMFPQINKQNIDANLLSIGLDSFDLLLLKNTLEAQLNRPFEDREWLQAKSIKDLISIIPRTKTEKNNARLKNEKEIHLGMPQMAIGGLNEHWLLKELGDFHWSLISQGLSTISSKITDSSGNRLYATFVRVKYTSNTNFKKYEENEKLKLSGELSRFGESIIHSKPKLENGKNIIKSELLTAFVTRGKTNSDLTKGKAKSSDMDRIPKTNSMPNFLIDYRSMRNEEHNVHKLENTAFTICEEIIDAQIYNLNPYQDINGVELLYFAAYPMINDICERNFFNGKFFKKDWALATSTTSRDIFYFSNCNISDQIVFRIHSYEAEKGIFSIHSSMCRQSDGKLMSRIFTIKEILK